MALDLTSYLAAGGETPRLWINFTDYTKKLLLGADENPWSNPAAYMSFYGQAHGLVKAEVVVLDVWDLFQHWMKEDPEAIPSMAGKRRVTVALRSMLEAYGPRELLAEVITALGNNYGSSTPLALVMPSPRSLLVKAHQAANGEVAEPDEMNIDTASMYVADFLRYFSETGLSGVLLVEDPELLPANSEELGWYQPIYNVAKHYRWSVGLCLPSADIDYDVPGDVNFAIAPAGSPTAAKVSGVDISDYLWVDQSGGKPATNGFYYLTIPADTKPEAVLETLATLKG
ncbi:MAG: hypothetical protein EP334_01580 [Gammaproteobacteria bacterium]|nr:MAG: hypothetical protein EP334_01580 [Gammaproteobacteria bacterium]